MSPLAACPGIPGCPLYVSSHAPHCGGCMDGDLLNACRVSRGEITYVDCYDETVARAMGRLTPEQLRQGNEAQERG